MDISYHRDWFKKQVEKADKLIEIYEKDGIYDAEIILCCTASALASTIWQRNHKDKIDRKRFVEFLVKFSTITPPVETISACILSEQLEHNKKNVELEIAIKKFFVSEFNYRGKSPFEYGESGSGLYAGTLQSIIPPEKIDTSEIEIQRLLPSLSLKEIRNASYASVIYSDLRSGLIHEYEVTGDLSGFGWHDKIDNLSYMNFKTLPLEQEVHLISHKHNISLNEARDALTKSQRKLYFPYSYIKNIIVSASNELFNYWENVEDFNQPYPQKWWIDG